jgi:hypothetical protein
MTIDQAVERTPVHYRTITGYQSQMLLDYVSSGMLTMQEAMRWAFPEEAHAIYDEGSIWGSAPPPER